MDGFSPIWVSVALGFAVVGWLLREEIVRRKAAEARTVAAELAKEEALSAGRSAEAKAAQLDVVTADLAAVREKLAFAEAALAAGKEREAGFERERQAITALRAEVETKFAALAGEALSKSNEAFLKLAGEALAKQTATASGEQKAGEARLKALLDPVRETVEKFGAQVETLEKSRLRDQSAIGQQMRQIAEGLETARRETGKLATALRAQPKTRGRWGEEQLRNILELAGMSAHCDFETEKGVRDSDDRLYRPDAVLRLPGGGVLVVDAKAPMEAYLDAVDAIDDGEREAHLVRHAKQVREHARLLASKKYWDRFDQSPDFVAMFIPGDNFFAAASERDPQLFQDAVENRVIIVTPSTMVALAKAAAFGWRQEEAAKRAQDVAKLGKDLYERLAVFGGHMEKLGKAMETGVRSYNAAVGSLERNVMSGARKLRDLNTFDTAKTAPELKPVETAARLPAPKPIEAAE